MRASAAAALVAAACAFAPVSARAQDASSWIGQALDTAASQTCGARRAAAVSTSSRMASVRLPERGKVIVVNIPSGVATAYEDGVPVIESRAVVGKEATQTPEMDTEVTYIRPNPTWTVPESILRRKGWREKLAKNPQWFEDNGFDVASGGRLVSPLDADPSTVTAFVQRPSPTNALGTLKIGIRNDQAIYLHDTNEPGLFAEEVRTASSGCVRIEKVRDIAAWALGVDRTEVDAMIAGRDVTEHKPVEPVRVILGYWTAWPDSKGRLQYYPDIYRKDSGASQCGAGEDGAPTEAGASEVWTEYEGR